MSKIDDLNAVKIPEKILDVVTDPHLKSHLTKPIMATQKLSDFTNLDFEINEDELSDELYDEIFNAIDRASQLLNDDDKFILDLAKYYIAKCNWYIKHSNNDPVLCKGWGCPWTIICELQFNDNKPACYEPRINMNIRRMK